MDPQFNFIQVNRAYAKADGHEPSFFRGKNHFDLYPDAENEDIFRRVVETGEPYFVYAKPFEYADHPERGVTYWDWSLIPIEDMEKVVTGLVLTLADVTERAQLEEELKDHRDHLKDLVGKRTAELRASEERFRTVADFTYGWEYWIDPDGHFVYVSPKGCSVLDQQSELASRIAVKQAMLGQTAIQPRLFQAGAALHGEN